MTPNSVCPDCGSLIPKDAPGGLCPKCLLQGALDYNPDTATRDTAPSPSLSGFATGEVLAIDETLGRYSVLGEKGKGGMGRVLLVHDEHLDRDIALKELLPDLPGGSTPAPVRHSKEMAARFLREAKITGQLEHPSITPVHELGRRADGTLYYTMKLIKGKPMSQAIRDARSLAERLKLLPHFVDLCNAIAYAHSKNVIHRDIKPSNVMIGDYGETVVIDWGLAKVKGQADERGKEMQETLIGMRSDSGSGSSIETAYGQAMGTPAYMPPEQAEGKLEQIDERSDIYSLGAVLYEILTGTVPFDGMNLGHILRRVVNDPPAPIREIEPRIQKDLDALCMKALEKDPAKRHQSARDFGEAVQNWKPKKKVSRLKKIMRATVLAVVVIVPLTIWALDTYYGRLLDAEYKRIRAEGGMLGPDDFRSRREEKTVPLGKNLSDLSVQGFLVSIHKSYPGGLEDAMSKNVSKLTIMANDPKTMTVNDVQSAMAIIDEASDILDRVEYAVQLPPLPGQEIMDAMEIRERGPQKALIPQLQTWRHMANLFKLRAAIYLREGRHDESMDQLLRILELGGHLEDTPTLMSAMIACAVNFIAVDGMDIWFDSETISPAKAAVFREALQDASDRDAVTAAIETERYGFMYAFREDEDIRTKYLKPLRFAYRIDEFNVLRIFGKYMRVSSRPFYESHPLFVEISTEIESLHGLAPTSAIAIPDLSRVSTTWVNMEARLDVADTALGLILYKQAHGAYPDTLAALVPEYEDAVPVDVFDGQPLRYERKGDGFLLYSVGEDLDDDKGRRAENGTDGDTVWNATR